MVYSRRINVVLRTKTCCAKLCGSTGLSLFTIQVFYFCATCRTHTKTCFLAFFFMPKTKYRLFASVYHWMLQNNFALIFRYHHHHQVCFPSFSSIIIIMRLRSHIYLLSVSCLFSVLFNHHHCHVDHGSCNPHFKLHRRLCQRGFVSFR